jgi:uncharacterized protein
VPKAYHEIRDPIHNFIRVDRDERTVIDSRPVQRLRHIHQLAMTFLVYPGTTHRRFEHSLGVMDLAGRVFDVITHPSNKHFKFETLDPALFLPDHPTRAYWRRVVRLAALCHDLGHLPFSHAAEHDLLPERWNHERLSVELIKSDEMERIWKSMTPPVNSDHIARLAVGPKEIKEPFTEIESLLSEIIAGDSFGVDRIDYLLRDSHHAGVAYGKFDHFRLIDTLRIIESEDTDHEPYFSIQLGVEEGGLHSAIALLLARYFMFSQVYLHRIRRAYDVHLKDFLRAWLPGGMFATDLEAHLALTDNEVFAAMSEAARDKDRPGSEAAARIMRRNHFRVLWELDNTDLERNPKAGELIAEAAKIEFGDQAVRYDFYGGKDALIDFPVLQADGRVMSARSRPHMLDQVPRGGVGYVFIDGTHLGQARRWLRTKRDSILSQQPDDNSDGG